MKQNTQARCGSSTVHIYTQAIHRTTQRNRIHRHVVAVVQYTFIHRLYTEQHNETEYTGTLWQQYSTHLHTDNKQNNTMKQNTDTRSQYYSAHLHTNNT